MPRIAKTVGGPHGPVPKRSDQRRRQNKPEVELVKAPSLREVHVPTPDETWHQIAKDWFESLDKSGQHQFYEESDWAVARFVAEMLSREMNATRPSASRLQAIIAGFADLLVTEGARRRVRIELEKGPPKESPAVLQLEKYRSRITNA